MNLTLLLRRSLWLPLLLVVGCTPSPFDADVSGKITLDGAPVEPGVVVFSAVGGGKNSSRGKIDSSGNYFLVTQHARGIGPGSYRVSVRVFEKGEAPGPGERAPANLPPLVPEKYLQPTTSGLKFEVQSGANTIDIELTSSENGG